MNGRDWLVQRPIAHRGLHDAAKGIVENSRAAAEAAMARGFAIECDVQLSADGEAFVFHDDRLDRLTGAKGALGDFDARTLAATRLAGADETILEFAGLLALVKGAVGLICEIKSRFDGDIRLAERVVELAKGYEGPLAFKSFDPDIIAHLRRAGIARPLGIVAEANYDHPYFAGMSETARQSATAFLHIGETRPDFLSWSVDDLPHATPTLMRALGNIPVMTWTVRSSAQKQRAKMFADQIVFEGEPD